MPECLGGIEQFVQIHHTHETGPAKRRVINGVGAGERSGVGARGGCALRVPAGLDDDDRFCPGRGAGRGHEFRGVLNGLDVEQDRSGRAVGREVVEQIAEIDVDLISERYDRGKTQSAPRGPLDQARGNRAGLRNQRKVARMRHVCGETCIQPGSRCLDAQAIRPKQAHAVQARRLQCLVGERVPTLPETRGHDDG